MNAFKALDISELCNHKLIYGKLPESKGYGLDGICILKEDFKLKDGKLSDGIDYRFYVGEEADNIVCEGQELELNERVKAIHFIGFTYWGDACENFRLVYEDGTEEYVKVAFVDWSRSSQDCIETRFLIKNGSVTTAGICLSSGRIIHPVYFHHYGCRVNGDKKVRKMVFPDNMFMHIFAVTMEEEADPGREYLNPSNAERREYKTN